jgi:hypothetical protein
VEQQATALREKLHISEAKVHEVLAEKEKLGHTLEQKLLNTETELHSTKEELTRTRNAYETATSRIEPMKANISTLEVGILHQFLY